MEPGLFTHDGDRDGGMVSSVIRANNMFVTTRVSQEAVCFKLSSGESNVI